jgi:hypothetical protein
LKGRSTTFRAFVALALLAGFLAIAAVASGLTVRAGSLILDAEGGFAPQALPKYKDAPITLHGSGKLSTVSGELPPIVDTLTIEFDRHGHLETQGLAVCTAGQLQSTTPAAARRRCAGAIVGEGRGNAVVQFPEQAPIPISSPITIFNGPKKGGNDTVFAHAYTTVPVAATYVIPVVIEKINHGVFGYRTEAKIPKIAGGAGHPISGSLKIGRDWTFKGKKHSYVSARCENGRLQARVKVSFKDEGAGSTLLSGRFLRICKVSG